MSGASQGPGQKPDGAVRVAVASDGPFVAPHFGRCESYTIADISTGKERILSTQVVPNPGHEPGQLPKMLAGYRVNWIIAGGMGRRAAELFAEAGIRPLVGVQGSVVDAIGGFVSGRLVGGASLCEHDDRSRHGHDAGCIGRGRLNAGESDLAEEV